MVSTVCLNKYNPLTKTNQKDILQQDGQILKTDL